MVIQPYKYNRFPGTFFSLFIINHREINLDSFSQINHARYGRSSDCHFLSPWFRVRGRRVVDPTSS